MKKIRHLLTAHKKKSIAAGIILVLVLFFFLKGEKPALREVVIVEEGVVSQEVDVTGRVIPSRAVSLSPQSGGKVVSLPASVGDTVEAGALLLKIDTSDLQIRLARQRATLEKLRLDLSRAETSTAGEDSLSEAYEDAAGSIASAFVDIPAILDGIESMLRQDYLSNNELLIKFGGTAREYRESLWKSTHMARDTYETLFKEYGTIGRSSSPEMIELALEETYGVSLQVSDMVKDAQNLLSYLDLKMKESEKTEQFLADREFVATFVVTTNTLSSRLLSAQNVIRSAKVAAHDDSRGLSASQITLRQAELDVEDTLIQIRERSIVAPMKGVVTAVGAEVGESVSGGVPVVSLISAEQFQVEANLAEADIAKVNLGDKARIELDAFGSGTFFDGVLVFLDPAETLLDGVARYKATFDFVSSAENIKPGMTADVTVFGERKEGVLAVPQRSVITREGRRIVEVLEGETVVEKEVTTGLRGSDGNIEIISGLSVGEQVIVFGSDR